MTRPASPQPSQSSGPSSTFHQHVGELDLLALARQTREVVDWERILTGTDARALPWQLLENTGNFSLYTRDDGSREFGVLAIGTIKGSVPEVASLLASWSQEEYLQRMEALYGEEFLYGSVVRKVPYQPQEGEEDVHTQLSVRTATFAKPGGWLTTTNDWCFLDATSFDKNEQRLETLLTTLRPHDVLPAPTKTMTGKYFRDVIAGFKIEPDNSTPGIFDLATKKGSVKPGATVRVHFYGELSSSSRVGTTRLGRLVIPAHKNSASNRSIKRRLVCLAKGCDRLSHLVRRRRLGVQVLMDQKRMLFPSADSKCFSCENPQRLLAQLCRICGHIVCGDCSDKYEREVHLYSPSRTSQHRVRLENVRVCEPCMIKVDNADYSRMSDKALYGPTIFANSPTAQTPSADLKGLLQDALLNAPSTKRKATVMSVIRCVLDQEEDAAVPLTPSPQRKTSVLLTPASKDRDYVAALDDLEVKPAPHTDIEIAGANGRAYPIDTRADAPVKYVVPENENDRLEAIKDNLPAVGDTLEELDILCTIAAKELGTTMSTVTLITAEDQRVIGSNQPELAHIVMKREQTFCQHTIMDNKPLVIPQPEADIRFNDLLPVTAMGARFYCGFPIVADDGKGTVIGSLCCMDTKSTEITETQYAVMEKLAKTASKVVKIERERRRRSTVSTDAPHLPRSRSTEAPSSAPQSAMPRMSQ